MPKLQLKVFAKGLIKKIKENGSIVGAVASTGSTDRDGEILDPKGWDLKAFKKAPRLLWAHDSRQLPIGKISRIETDDKGRLVFDAEFAEKENSFAKQVADLVRGGFLNTFSVGFRPLEFDRETDTYKKMELLEISMVNVPANAEARLSFEYKSFEKSEKSMFDKKEKIKKVAKKKKIEKRYLSEEKRLLIRNTITTLKEVLDSTEPMPKKGGQKVGSRKAQKTDGVLEALRTVDRAVEIAIHREKRRL